MLTSLTQKKLSRSAIRKRNLAPFMMSLVFRLYKQVCSVLKILYLYWCLSVFENVKVTYLRTLLNPYIRCLVQIFKIFLLASMTLKNEVKVIHQQTEIISLYDAILMERWRSKLNFIFYKLFWVETYEKKKEGWIHHWFSLGPSCTVI